MVRLPDYTVYRKTSDGREGGDEESRDRRKKKGTGTMGSVRVLNP